MDPMFFADISLPSFFPDFDVGFFAIKAAGSKPVSNDFFRVLMTSLDVNASCDLARSSCLSCATLDMTYETKQACAVSHDSSPSGKMHLAGWWRDARGKSARRTVGGCATPPSGPIARPRDEIAP